MPPPGVDLPLSIGGGRGYGNFPRRFLAVGEELLPLEGGVIAPRGVLLPPLTPICPPPPPGGLVWAKVGPVGAVVAFAIVIALVCYLSQSRRK